MYDSRIVYPPEFDEYEICTRSDTCPYADGKCFNVGHCIADKESSE